MSFRQKSSRSRNRRVSNVRQRRQQHLLDVKVRSRRVTRHRIRRAMGMFSRVILLVVLLAAICVGAREAARRITRSLLRSMRKLADGSVSLYVKGQRFGVKR